MSKKKIIAVALLLLVAAGVFLLYLTLKPEPAQGGKTIEVSVIHGDLSEKNFSITTDAENLRAALEQENLIYGDESEYGLFINTVDGETADADLQQWWCITKAGEMLSTGVDDTMINDGESYELTFTTGW